MGAKTAVKLRTRGTAYKCELCGRKLMSPEAVIVHQRTAHNIITRRNKAKPAIKPDKTQKSELKAKPVKKSPSPPRNPAIVKEDKAESLKRKLPDSPTQDAIKQKCVEFECPKCFRVFTTYFPAHKHIQKFHCVNRQGAKVPPHSPSLIQPVRIELCLKCNRKVKSIQTHICDNSIKDETLSKVYVCKGCDQWFPNLTSFDMHVLSLHGDEVESMFFPTNIEFSKWKLDMETQTIVTYSLIDKSDSKKYYHCDHHHSVDNETNTKTTYFCPSTIVIQEYSKGIQVHFYKQHFEHAFNNYALSDKYKKYSITSFLKRSEEYINLPSASDTNDMYLQFKSLMEGIVVDAAKINIPSLKILIGKALEMTSILTNYDEEGDDSQTHHTNQSMNDEQIEKALVEACSNYAKKKVDMTVNEEQDFPTFSICKTESLVSSPKIVNSFSLADKDIKDITIKNDDENKTDKSNVSNDKDTKKRFNDLDQSPSSFNDSYKDFVVKNFPVPEADLKKRNARGRPTIVKTKIGQYKPVSPKLIGPAIEAKKIMPDRSPMRLSLDKPKVDFEYEVKEQQDGCNILILKI